MLGEFWRVLLPLFRRERMPARKAGPMSVVVSFSSFSPRERCVHEYCCVGVAHSVGILSTVVELFHACWFVYSLVDRYHCFDIR